MLRTVALAVAATLLAVPAAQARPTTCRSRSRPDR